jgi:hypothetical protein
VRVLTDRAVLVCLHELGTVENRPSQSLVRIDGARVLVDNDPEMRSISFCPNIGMTIKPCQQTLRVQVGYSTWVKIDGHGVCLDTVRGLTDGTPPGAVEYKVRLAGQKLVESAA